MRLRRACPGRIRSHRTRPLARPGSSPRSASRKKSRWTESWTRPAGVRLFPRRTSSVQRDFPTFESDGVTLVFDSLHDRRSGFSFTINAAGAKRDQQLSNDGQGNLDWDGVWDVKTSRNDEGWVIEFMVPFAQVEVDQQQVNLTRFNLFFPAERSLSRLQRHARHASRATQGARVHRQADEPVQFLRLSRRVTIRPEFLSYWRRPIAPENTRILRLNGSFARTIFTGGSVLPGRPFQQCVR